MLRSRWCLMMLCLVLAAATAGVRAEDAPGKEKPAKPKMAKTVGTVSAVDADSITVTPKAKKAKKAKQGEAAAEPEPVTFTVGEDTKVRVDGKEASLADVAAGYAVKVMAVEGQQAVKINAVSPEEQARRAEAKKARAAKKKDKDKGRDKGKGKDNAEAGDGEAEPDEAAGDQM